MILATFFTMIVILQYTSATSIQSMDECQKPQRGLCSFYTDCLESRYHCGPTGYPLGYGQVYCDKFVAAESTLSPEGQRWMLDTMECLQQVLVPEATNAPGSAQTCDELQEKAFNSHPACYTASGLCWLGVGQWEKIIGIIGLKTLLGSWSAVNETLRTAEDCVAMYANSIYLYSQYR